MGINVKFHDAREKSIDQTKLIEFENAFFKKLYLQEIDNAPKLMGDIGVIMIDYMDAMEWGREVPDINEKSTRLFSFWGEENDTNTVTTIVRGIMMLAPFTHDTLVDFYKYDEEKVYYPLTFITSFKTLYKELDQIEQLLDLLYIELNNQWKKLKGIGISSIQPNTDLWNRFNSSVDQVLQYTFMCPMIERELIEALKLKGYTITSNMQVLTSPAPSFDKAALKEHIQTSLKLRKHSELSEE